MKRYLLLIILLASLNGCSIQINGLHDAYQSPNTVNAMDMATLQLPAKNILVMSVDGKSIRTNLGVKPLMLNPGEHEITLYIGKNNYVSKVNNMVVLSASFKANETYFIKATEADIWIENSQGIKVSSIKSTMKFDKSVEL
jgi:hypothetical protein